MSVIDFMDGDPLGVVSSEPVLVCAERVAIVAAARSRSLAKLVLDVSACAGSVPTTGVDAENEAVLLTWGGSGVEDWVLLVASSEAEAEASGW